MKRLCALLVALCLLVMCGCGNGNNNTPSNDQANGPSENAQTDAPSGNNDNNAVTPPEDTTPADTTPEDAAPADTTPEDTAPVVSGTGPTDINFSSEVNALEGEWKLSQVYVDGEAYDAVADALSLSISLDVDPYELVDGDAYIHNQVYNLSGSLKFGVQSVVDELAEDDVDSYKGSGSWEDFTMGKVMADGEWYEQPGPSLMSFKDIDDYGLYLEEIAGVAADVDTTNKRLIIGMNSSGQLLLGYSDEHIERPGTSGEWVYCLIFDK